MNKWIGSLSKHVFEQCSSFAKNFWHIVSMRINTLGISNLVASTRHSKEKTPHFRLRCISQKRLCASSPTFDWLQPCSGHAFFVGVVEAQVAHASVGSCSSVLTRISYTGVHSTHWEAKRGSKEEKNGLQFLDTVNSTFSPVWVLDKDGCFLKTPKPIKFCLIL